MTENILAFDVKGMDSTSSPCENFYTYAIGNWQKLNPVPPTESRWMSFNILHEENKKKLQGILDETMQNKSAQKGSVEQLIRDLYKSALDTQGTSKKGLTPLSRAEQVIESITDLSSLNIALGKLLPLGIGGPVALYVTIDRKNSNAYVIGASQTGLSLPDRDYYLKDELKMQEIRKSYVQHINNMFEIAGTETPDAGDRILDLETKIAGICWPREELRVAEKTYNKMLLKDWDASLKNLNIAGILKSAGYPVIDSLVVGQPSFYNELDKLLTTIDITDWKLWLRWKMLHNYGPYINDDFVREDFSFFSSKLQGVKEMKPRKERILEQVDNQLGEPLGKLFVEKYFPPESKKYVADMIENLRSAYRESIQSLKWMGPETKKKALEKLEAFTYKIGYPNKWEDYSTLDIQPDLYLQNLMNISQFEHNLMLEKYGKPVDKEVWHMHPQTVNAYYSPVGNEVVFPAGILQPPFFHVTFDDAINYGGIGAVIGHEFTHGFDDQGSKYDGKGNMNNWWTEEDRMQFDSLAQVLVQQYNAVEVLPGKFINGQMTLGENIADLGGLTLAYAALERHLEKKSVIPKPIDGFSWQQRFYLGWANVWKGNITEEELSNRLLTDYHSPGEYRVRIPLQNLSPFHEAFGCRRSIPNAVKIW